MKKSILVTLAMLIFAAGCAKTAPDSSDESLRDITATSESDTENTAGAPETSADAPKDTEVAPDVQTSEARPLPDYVGEKVDTISFSKDMGGYSINVSIDVHDIIDSDSYQLITNYENVTVKNSSGETVSDMIFGSPFIAGAPRSEIVSDYRDVTVKLLELASGNLLVIGVPVEVPDGTALGLSVYYFDDHFVNYIGRNQYGGDFWPLIAGGIITTDGDTFTLNEYESSLSSEKKTVTYSVDFENILIKEVEQ